MEWNDAAVVLATGKFRESDMWLRIFSQKRGVMTVFAFGGSRSRRRFCGCLDVLNTIHCRVKSSRNGQYMALEEGSLVHGPQKLRHDFNRLGMLMNCVKFLQVFGVCEDGAARVYTFLQEFLQYFEGFTAPHSLFPVLFRLRIAAEQGFAPALKHCSVCKTDFAHGQIVFYMDEGLCCCPHCARKSSAHSVQLSLEVVQLLQRVASLRPEQWNVERLLSHEKSMCFRAVDGFIQYHLGIIWEDGRFRRL